MFEIINSTEFEISIDNGKVTVYTSVPNVSCSTREPGRKLKQLYDILSRAVEFHIMPIESSYRGVHLLFKNGVEVSIQWGAGNYGDNHDVSAVSAHRNTYEPGERRMSNSSSEAEIAVWLKEGPWITKHFHGNDWEDVLGYQSPVQVLRVLQWAERFDPETIKPLALPEGTTS